jgi:hypothetical protein
MTRRMSESTILVFCDNLKVMLRSTFNFAEITTPAVDSYKTIQPILPAVDLEIFT